NVLLLKNNLNLSPDISEVSQEKLLSLVAERLIDSNSNVNVRTSSCRFWIDDFEFTPECAIFDLLDIPLYHGWIVDPQDYETANAIGPKSYNALMGELVALETLNMGDGSNNNAKEDDVDFVAATTATLGIPSPCLSKATSFNDSPRSVPDEHKARKGDLEEEAELLRALKLSESEFPKSVDSLVTDVNGGFVSVTDERTCEGGSVHLDANIPEHVGVDNNRSTLSNDNHHLTYTETLPGETCSSSKTDESYSLDQSAHTESGDHFSANDASKNGRLENLVLVEDTLPVSSAKITTCVSEETIDFSLGGQKVENQSASTNVCEPADISNGHDIAGSSGLSSSIPESDSSSGRLQNIDTPEIVTSSVDGSEPIYEGEECILDSGTSVYEDREPMYEGEVILAEQGDKTVVSPKAEITPHQGELIRNFLKNSASQLTFYGLFCLQDGLKERELCVFFRNNHFSTMFKYDGELYLLATDQGYINQPDLVWEKLNEVNGDTLFMTGNFREFKVESHANETWDEHNAVASTADYLASIDSATQAGLDYNSDLQLAIALQQQEFDQQQPQSRQHNAQQPSVGGGSRLITGPQAPRSSGRSAVSSKPEAKSKDKCVLM
ncbi:hypothetical protein Tsubulata_002005, partial [Turnera subulata]